MCDEIKISDNRRITEIVAVLLTSLGKFICMDLLEWRFPYIAVTIIGWSIYIIYRYKSNPGTLTYWGFRFDNFATVMKSVWPFGLIAVISFFLIGFAQQTLNPTWHVIPILVIYPLWGVIQQFLVMSLVAGNLDDMKVVNVNKSYIIIISAVIFGIIHLPYWWLVLATTVLAMFYGFVFLKSRNVWVLGLFHGILGGLFFYTVVDRDPFIEVFGGLM